MKKSSLIAASLGLMLAIGPVFAQGQRTPPKPVSQTAPSYPEELTDSGISGRAEVDVTVKADGSLADIELGMASHRAFGKAAMSALKTWRFEPGARDGAPADTRVTIPFNFTAPFEQQVNATAKRKVFADLPSPAISQQEYGRKLKVKKEAPPAQYPRSIRGERPDEKVEIKFVVGPDGRTLNPEIVGTPKKDFIAPAIQHVVQTTYEPPVTKSGQPAYVATTTTIRFTDFRPSFGGGGGGGGFGGGGGGGFGGGGGGGGEMPD